MALFTFGAGLPLNVNGGVQGKVGTREALLQTLLCSQARRSKDKLLR